MAFDDAQLVPPVDALKGTPRNDWERFAGPNWADDTIAYARLLAHRSDVAVTWVESPPLGIGVKRKVV